MKRQPGRVTCCAFGPYNNLREADKWYGFKPNCVQNRLAHGSRDPCGPVNGLLKESYDKNTKFRQTPDGRWVCFNCGLIAAKEDFIRSKVQMPRCVICVRCSRRTKLAYTGKMKLAQLVRQNFKCPVTGEDLSLKSSPWDHCHDTGKLRSVLTHAANTAIGIIGDDPAVLRRAADYIEKHRLSHDLPLFA